MKFGFAEGQTAVTYVDNIRHYEGMLALQNLPGSKLPPISLKTLPSRCKRLTHPCSEPHVRCANSAALLKKGATTGTLAPTLPTRSPSD